MLSVVSCFLTGCVSLNGRVNALPSEEQLKAFQSVKTVKIIVEQSYGAAKGVNLPFEEVTGRLFGYAGIKVVKADAKEYDATITIKARGEAQGKNYRPPGNDYGLYEYSYSGAFLSGTISSAISGINDYKKTFEGYIAPPEYTQKGRFPTPYSAPFDLAFQESGSFVSKTALMIGEIYGHYPLITALKDEHGYVRANAAWALGEIKDPRAIDPLFAIFIHDKEGWVRGSARKALVKIGNTATEPLISALKDESWLVRNDAAASLGEIKDFRAVGPLISVFLNDEKELVRMNAKEALVKTGKSAAEPLIVALKKDSSNVRWGEVKEVLVIMGKSAVEPIISALKDKSWSARGNAAAALGEIKDSRAVKPLIVTLQDENSDVRKNAAESLDKLGWTPANDTERAVYYLAKRKWKQCLQVGTLAVEPFISALKDENSYVRREAAWALGELKDPRAVEPLIAVIKDTEGNTVPALKKITGKDFGENPEEWRNWWKKETGIKPR
jgi:HEAT repeat protein